MKKYLTVLSVVFVGLVAAVFLSGVISDRYRLDERVQFDYGNTEEAERAVDVQITEAPEDNLSNEVTAKDEAYRIVDEETEKEAWHEVDFSKEVLTADEWLLYEKAVNHAETLEELCGLYRDGLDGAISYDYSVAAQTLYQKTTPYDFIVEAYALEDQEKVNGMLGALAGAVYGLDEYSDRTLAFPLEIMALLDSGKISEGEVGVAYRLLEDAPEILVKTPYSPYNVFSVVKPVNWYCADGDWDTYKQTLQWDYDGFIAESDVSSILLADGYSYEAENVGDYDLTTAWVEGVEGYGVGETIEFILKGNQKGTEITRVEIINGYLKSEETWEENARVKGLTAYVDNRFYGDLYLQDTKALQVFEFGPISLDQPEDVTVTFEIFDVYPGSKYEDTAMTELNFDGHRPNWLPETLVEDEALRQMYTKILNSESAIRLIDCSSESPEVEEVLLKDWRPDDGTNIWKYGIVDMDGDGNREMVVYVVTNMYHYRIVIHPENGVPMGYCFISEQMRDLKADGTYRQYKEDFYDIGRIAFGDDGTWSYVSEARRDMTGTYDENGEQIIHYYIGGEEVSQDELEAVMSEFDDSERLDWMIHIDQKQR